MKNRLYFSALFLFAILSDQLTKYLIGSHFELYEARIIIPDILSLRYIRNEGVAFGLHIATPTVMLVLSIIVILLLAYLFFKEHLFADYLAGRIAMTLIFGGAVGNLIDRFRMGEVSDFVQMGIGGYTWPVYNLADVYVTTGMCILVYLYLFKSGKSPGESEKSPELIPPAQ